MKASDNVFPKLLFDEVAAPATPAADTVIVYAKPDGLLYSKDDAGVETPLGSGGGGGTVDTVVAGTGIDVDATDPANPEVALDAATITSLGLADSALQPGDVIVPIGIACSDETTALTTGVAKATFRMPYAMTVTGVRCSVTTAPTGAVLTVDINESGSTILSTKLTIDAGEKTSTTAATPPVISDPALADDAEITIDIDTVGSTIAGAGLKVWILGYKT
jgi:hypothetical protein